MNTVHTPHRSFTTSAKPHAKSSPIITATCPSFIGNPLSVRAISRATVGPNRFGVLPLASYLKVAIPSTRNISPRNLLADSFWPYLDGSSVLRFGRMDRDRHWHWVAANLRTALMIVLAFVLVQAVLKGLSSVFRSASSSRLSNEIDNST
jgi:hypothetical protein